MLVLNFTGPRGIIAPLGPVGTIVTQPIPHPAPFVPVSVPGPVSVPIGGPITTPLIRPALIPAPTSLATIPQIPLAAAPISSLNPYPPAAPIHSVSYSTIPAPQPAHSHSHSYHTTHTIVHEAPKIARHITSPAAVSQDVVRSNSYRQSGAQRPPVQTYDSRPSLNRPSRSRSHSRQGYRDDSLGLHLRPETRELRRSNSDSRQLGLPLHHHPTNTRQQGHHRHHSERYLSEGEPRRSGSYRRAQDDAYYSCPSASHHVSHSYGSSSRGPTPVQTSAARYTFAQHAQAGSGTGRLSGRLGGGGRARTYLH